MILAFTSWVPICPSVPTDIVLQSLCSEGTARKDIQIIVNTHDHLLERKSAMSGEIWQLCHYPCHRYQLSLALSHIGSFSASHHSVVFQYNFELGKPW